VRRTCLFGLLVCFGVVFCNQQATADRIVAPFSCDVDRGQLSVEAGPVRMYRITGKSEERPFRVCTAGGCRTLIVHRFDVECAGGKAAWRDIVGRLIYARTRDTQIKSGSLVVELKKPSFATLNPLCGHDGGAHIEISDAARHWKLDATCREFGHVPEGPIRLPRGFAFVAEIGGRILIDKATPTPVEPPMPGRKPYRFTTAQIPTAPINPALTAPPVRVAQAGARYPVESGDPVARLLLEREHKAPAARPLTTFEPSGSSQDTPPRVLSAVPASTELRGESHPVTLDSWSTIVEVIRVGTADGVSGEARRNAQHSLIATMLGLALLTSLFSGIGWIAGRQFWRPPDIRKVDPYQVMLRREVVDLAKPDAQMCGELCRSAQGLVGHIHGGVSELQGVAPLRRVLLREVRNMEKFLSATIAEQPSEPQEWRRMRLRLQRVVTDLMRLKDITDGAKKSLTMAVIAKDLPKDKHEAYEALGANPEASEKILKRLVDALRATWHPDHAVSEEDRQAREERIKQINVAWDLIQDKRVEA
jgi:hypothetical protein